MLSGIGERSTMSVSAAAAGVTGCDLAATLSAAATATTTATTATDGATELSLHGSSGDLGSGFGS